MQSKVSCLGLSLFHYPEMYRHEGTDCATGSEAGEATEQQHSTKVLVTSYGLCVHGLCDYLCECCFLIAFLCETF